MSIDPPPPPMLDPTVLKDYDLTDECRELISCLPVENCWISTYLHKYQGYWFATQHLQGVLQCHKRFQALDTDILLVTTPKSGTTWLKAIAYAILNRHKYKDVPKEHPLLSNNPHDLVPYLENNLYAKNNIVPDLSTLFPSSPRLFSTHSGYETLSKTVKESACKLVYLCRNPKDTFVSLWHFSCQLRHESKKSLSLEEAFDMFCRGVSRYGPFWDHVIGYWKASLEHPQKIMFLKYEDLKENPVAVMKKVAEFIGLPFTKEEEDGPNNVVDDIFKLCSFENMSNLEVNKTGKLRIIANGPENRVFFRRGQVGDWKNFLTHEMIQKLDSLTDEKFGAYGLKF